MKNAIKWPVAAAGALLVAIAAYVAVNSVDCEPPDMSKFDNRFVVPSDADNVYCGLVAVTNVVSEKTGLPILASLFDESNGGMGPIQRFPNEPLTDADKDAILAESSKALSLYHEAVRRKAWWSCDPVGKREPFPHVDAFWRLCVLVHLEAQRRLELGETSAAIDDVGDMLLLARKIENDAESGVRWLTTRLLVEKAGDIAMKIAKSEKSTDEDLVRLQAALAQYDVASRPERAQRMLNNELAVYFAWLCDPAHSLDPDDLSDDGEFSHLMLHVPFLSHYFYHRNRTLSLCAGNIEKMKQGLRSGYDKAAWEKAYGEMFNGLGVGCFSPNFSGSRLVAYNLQSSGLIKDFQNGSKWYDAVESAVAAAAGRFNATVWRGETAYVEIPEALRGKVSCLSERWTGDDIKLTLLRFDEVKYDLVEKYTDGEGKNKARVTGKGTVRDIYREWKIGDKDLPSMIKIAVKPGAKPFNCLFELDKTGDEANFLNVKVVDRVLPPAKDWKYFLDLWQHPWAVSRYFGVEPFSKEHYAKMEPVWRALAESGCKALTVTLLELPWNNQCYDAYHSMIGRVKKADGTWAFDYRLFDEYVAFGRKCGLGPDIACYTMCPWGYMVSWKEEVTGNGERVTGNGERVTGNGGLVERREKLLPGTPEFEDYWGDFLVDFEKHLKEKGWFADTYIAMDERAPEDVRKIVDFIQKKSPGMKVAMAGNRSPAEFSGMKIDNYCQGLIHLRKHPQMLDDLEPRRRAGCKTTFYVCCTAAHPNTFMDSPLDEGFWLGAYPVMVGFDGFLRWAANSWPKDPYDDASFKTIKNGNLQWRPGDVFLVYPNGELSARMIALRAGVVAAEKMRILREEGNAAEDIEAAIKRIAAPYGYKAAVRGEIDFAAFRRDVEKFVNAVR